MSKASTIGSAKSSMKRKNSIWHALPYIAPHFIIFAVFGIIPIVFGIGLAFTRWNMVGAPKFVGLQNFAKIFDPSTYFYSIFWRDLGHTLLFVLVSVPLTIIVPLLLAVALSKKGLKGAGLFQAIFYIPGLISIAAGALVWRMVFNSQFGLLNTTFHSDINWLGKNPYAWITIFVLVLWALRARRFADESESPFRYGRIDLQAGQGLTGTATVTGLIRTPGEGGSVFNLEAKI